MAQVRRAYTVHGYTLPSDLPPNQLRRHLTEQLLTSCDALIAGSE